MDKKKKTIIIIIISVLVAAIALTGIIIFTKEPTNKGVVPVNTAKEETRAPLSIAIRALSDSTFKDLELARMIYTVGISRSTELKDNFAETASETLQNIVDGIASEQLLKMIPDGLYGGKKITSSIEGVSADPVKEIKNTDFVLGDLLFVTEGNETKNYIYDNGGLVDLSNAGQKVDTESVLKGLLDSDIFAVFRPTLIMEGYDYATKPITKLDLTPEQEAVIVTAYSFLLRGEKLQYADTRLGSDSDSEFRWKAGFYSPEDYSSDNWGYTNCAAFTYDVYYNALGYDLCNGDKKLYTTNNQMNHSEELGIRKYHMLCETADSYSEEDKEKIKKEIFDILQPADILVVRRGGNGHSMLYIGDGNIIHSGGGVYNYSESKEVYEASIRQMRFEDYFFTEGAGGYIFGSDVGKQVSSFAILRPIDSFEGEIPQTTKNRIANMQGVMAQKLSSHNNAKTVNVGEEITFTFEIYNSNDKEVTLEVQDTVPSHTTYLEGAQSLSENKLSWDVTIPANSRKSLSYTVKVNPDAASGYVVRSEESSVGGVPVKCPSITIARTLDSQEQTQLSTAIEENNKNTSLKGLTLVNKIYKDGIGVEKIFSDTDIEEVLTGEDGIFYFDPYGAVAISGARDHQLNKTGKYHDMLVPTLYGGRSFLQRSWCNRTRLAREHNLVIGDILIRKTLEQNQIFIYAGDDVFYNLTDGFSKDTLSVKQRLETCLATGNCYAVLRPSFSIMV